ncbi:hypothetical protein PINS_up008406 [Pythium insidiosum]|nr:hypothetical protein PINS_up008406 [Pythium insidiosum]
MVMMMMMNMKGKATREQGNSEATLRLKLLVGICVSLSALFGAVLTLSRPANRQLWQAATPVFIADMEDVATFKATVDANRVRRVDVIGEGREGTQSQASVAIVETLPVGDFNLTSAALSTHEVLLTRTREATRTIDISAMYWYVTVDLFRCVVFRALLIKSSFCLSD